MDPAFRRAVALMDAGSVDELRVLLTAQPELARMRVRYAPDGYFATPSLLEFIAQNPVRSESMPDNVLDIARTVIDAGADEASITAALELVASGRVPREAGHQGALIRLLCERGGRPEAAMHAALGHGEFAAADALMGCGARFSLPVAAARGDIAQADRLLPTATAEERHRALALAAQFGQTHIVRALLDAGEDASRFNPPLAHAHSTPLHQAVGGGHLETAKLLTERGARLDVRDKAYGGTPLDWADHAKREDIAAYLRGRMRE